MNDFDDEHADAPDFDVHNDEANLKSGSMILNILCFIFVIIGTFATFDLLAIVVLCTAFPTLIVAKSKPIKGLALSALLGVLAAYFIALTLEVMK